ncbi:cupin protein [Listeria monocytogenes]|nr:cupin protein [Listeria monocytogenes]
MDKPAIFRSAVPMFHVFRDCYHVALSEQLGRFSFFLIVASSACHK